MNFVQILRPTKSKFFCVQFWYGVVVMINLRQIIMRYLRFLLFYLPLIFLPSIILPAVLVMTLIALLKVCEELGCLAVVGYFLILAPIVVCISVIVTHHFLAKKIIQRFSRTIEEKTTFTKLIIIHGFLLVLLSAMPIMVIAVYLNISNFSSNLFYI